MFERSNTATAAELYILYNNIFYSIIYSVFLHIFYIFYSIKIDSLLYLYDK